MDQTALPTDSSEPLAPLRKGIKRVPKSSVSVRVKRANRTPSKTERWEIIEAFCSGTTDFSVLGHKFSTSNKEISRVITGHWDKLTNLREAKLLTDSQNYPSIHKSSSYHALKSICRAQEDPNGKFHELLSLASDPVLSDSEITFASTYVVTGSYAVALKEAKLDIGVLKAGKNETGESQALRMRCAYLKAKPNVAAFIMKLKQDSFIPEAIDKNFIQAELLEQLSHAKEDHTSQGALGKKNQLRIIEALGRTIGAFQDKVLIEKIDPAAALDYLESLNIAEAEVISPISESLEESTLELPYHKAGETYVG